MTSLARNNAPKIELTAYDDLFQTDESRAEAKLSKISSLVPFVSKFPRNTELYKLMTTKFGEV